MSLPELPGPVGPIVNILQDIKDLGPIIHHAQEPKPIEEGALFRAQVGPEIIVASKYIHPESGFPFQITPANSLIYDVVLAAMNLSPKDRNETTFRLAASKEPIDLNHSQITKYDWYKKEYIILPDVLLQTARATAKAVRATDESIKQKKIKLKGDQKRYWDALRQFFPDDDPLLEKPENFERILSAVVLQQILVQTNKSLHRAINATFAISRRVTEVALTVTFIEDIAALFNTHNPLINALGEFYKSLLLANIIAGAAKFAENRISNSYARRLSKSAFLRADENIAAGMRLFDVKINPPLPPTVDLPKDKPTNTQKVEEFVKDELKNFITGGPEEE